VHGGVAKVEVLLRVDGVPARAELDARRPPVPDQHHVGGRAVAAAARPAAGRLLLRR